MNSQPPPKGSLEELFRHHLLESEAAAVPPRPLVWDHIDNSLLLAQNEKYRRRLLVHRWGMAASLLLAALAGGGWWHSQQASTTTLASANRQTTAPQAAVASAVAPARPAAAMALPAGSALAGQRAGTATALNPAAGQSLGAADELAYATQHQAAAGQRSAGSRATAGALGRQGHGRAAMLAAAYQAQAAGQRPAFSHPHTSSFSSPNGQPIGSTATSSFTAFSGSAFGATATGAKQPAASPAFGQSATPASEMALAALDQPDSRAGENNLALKPVALALGAAAGSPVALVPKDVALTPPTELRRWRFGAEYAATAFQPNIDFNRNTGDYNMALGSNTVSLTRAAAAEYRANLRAGLGQRLSLRATRWLGGHWSLSSGLEVSQQTAYSATSAAFTGEQIADLSAAITNPGGPNNYALELRSSSYQYRSVGIPVGLQYDNQIKSGVSIYGRLGAIVSALLNVRSEVAGNAEATRTYSFFSASTPYRRLTALLRGSAGVRYRPAGRGWGLNVGPTAEAGVQSMNTETDRGFLQQSRPYSVGIEAGLEFGGGLKSVQ